MSSSKRATDHLGSGCDWLNSYPMMLIAVSGEGRREGGREVGEGGRGREGGREGRREEGEREGRGESERQTERE